MSDKVYLNSKQLAKMLNVHPDTPANWRDRSDPKNGIIIGPPWGYLGKSPRYDLDDVIEYMEKNKVKKKKS